ncbi:MAG: NTP transferase domain-containing protein [Lachnospiraceae bacterium]|nr:NTP transferase domain-containing protein [Lachnospiraceae bacterium]
MHKADKAIIMAAGLGNRMRPITEQIPKPLIAVQGKRMIDTVVDALHANGITQIYVVVGYLKHVFEEWVLQYEDITLIENPYYQTCNNISSLYVAREHLGNCIILDGDQMIYNPEVLNPTFEASGYCSVWTEEATDEWLQTVADGKVISCSRSGGTNGWQLYSVSFWTKQDGQRLKDLLEEEFERKQHTDIYWDDIAMFCYPEQFELTVRPIEKADIVEIDDYQELLGIDKTYKEREKGRGYESSEYK